MSAKKKSKQYSVVLDPAKVMGANISRYSDGYSYANMSFKMSDKERMNVNYEWQGGSIPEFAMHVMEIMQGLGDTEKASLETEEGAELLERMGNVLLDRAAKMNKDDKKKKDGEDEEDDVKDKKKKKK